METKTEARAATRPILVPDSIHSAMKLEAAQRGKNLGDLATSILAQWLNKQQIRDAKRDGRK